MRKQINFEVYGILVLVLILIFISNASAKIVAAIQSPPTIYVTDVNTGETAERFVRVLNRNDFPVIINITVSGDLADKVELNEENLRLEVGEKKNVYFTIKSDESGETETRINLLFSTLDGKEKIGYSVKVIFIASGEDLSGGNNGNDGTDRTDNPNDNVNIGNVNVLGNENNNKDDSGEKEQKMKISPLVLLLLSSIVLLIILIILVVVASKRKPKKVVEREGKEPTKTEKEGKINLKKRPKRSRE